MPKRLNCSRGRHCRNRQQNPQPVAEFMDGDKLFKTCNGCRSYQARYNDEYRRSGRRLRGVRATIGNVIAGDPPKFADKQAAQHYNAWLQDRIVEVKEVSKC